MEHCFWILEDRVSWQPVGTPLVTKDMVEGDGLLVWQILTLHLHSVNGAHTRNQPINLIDDHR